MSDRGVPDPGPQPIRFEEGDRWAERGNAAQVQPVVRFSEGPSSTSVTWVSIDGRHQRLRSRRSARCYYMLSGMLTFEIGSAPPVCVGAGDAIVVPHGCVYGFSGTATYLVINTPAFEPGDDEYADPACSHG